jgi:hypothetical protein
MYKDNPFLPVAFTGRTERFYVLRNEGLQLPRKYVRYRSEDAYNTRAEVPVYIDAAEALSDFDHEVKIYPESLTTTPPTYPVERDETNLGLTPARQLWAARFARDKGRTHHAA